MSWNSGYARNGSRWDKGRVQDVDGRYKKETRECFVLGDARGGRRLRAEGPILGLGDNVRIGMISRFGCEKFALLICK